MSPSNVSSLMIRASVCRSVEGSLDQRRSHGLRPPGLVHLVAYLFNRQSTLRMKDAFDSVADYVEPLLSPFGVERCRYGGQAKQHSVL